MGAKYTAQATTSKDYRIKSIVICAFLMILALTALGLLVYNLVKLNILFVLGYLIGIALALVAVMMRMNTAFPTHIAADRRTLLLTAWDNMLMPFNVDYKVSFIREFVPAKVVTKRVDILGITDIYIGTRSYIERSTDEGFARTLKSMVSEKYLKRISKSDLFVVKSVSGYSIMLIDNFDTRAIGKVVSSVLRSNENIEVHTSSKKYRVYLKK